MIKYNENGGIKATFEHLQIKFVVLVVGVIIPCGTSAQHAGDREVETPTKTRSEAEAVEATRSVI